MSGALVVGVGPGLGSAIARRFASEGYDLALVSRTDPPSADDNAASDRVRIQALHRQVDAADWNSLAAAERELIEDLGSLNVVVYNAIRFTADPPSRVQAPELQRDLDVALGGLVTTVQAVLPALRTSAQSGAPTSILITGGGAALYPQADQGTLPMTKAAQRAYSLALSDELDGSGIRVATITIAGAIGSSDHFSPDAIAGAFWSAHTQTPETRKPEVVYAI